MSKDTYQSTDPALAFDCRREAAEAVGPNTSSYRRSRALLWILLAGFSVRMLAVFFLYEEQLSPSREQFEFGWEVGRVARSVAAGHGFASPLFGDTGPTAWLPPVYVWLLAGVFRLFGTYTPSAAIAILTLNSAFSALTAWPLFVLAEKLLGHRAALLTSWSWAFFPYAIFIAATRIWGECLDALLVTTLILLSARLVEPTGKGIWIQSGLLAGLAVLTNPNTLSLLPAVWGVACWQLARVKRPWKFRMASAAFALALVVTPWLVRNWLIFGTPLPFRSNFWLEVNLGNNDTTPVMLVDWDRHPASNAGELEQYQRLGEIAYMERKRDQAIDYIRANPAAFLQLTLRRILFVWTGFWSWDRRYLDSEPAQVPLMFFQSAMFALIVVGVWKTRGSWPAFSRVVLAIAFFQPLIYYVTHPALEYRHAIDPILLTAAVMGVGRGFDDVRT